MLLWMKREHRIMNDPLAEVRKVPNPGAGGFRRALSLEEMRHLLATAPRHRAIVYQVILYTGLRRAEMAGLRWDDFKLDDAQPCVRVPSSISKNRKETVHYLRPEVVASLKELRPNGVLPEKLVFQGLMPRVPTLKRDLATAGIPFEDARGRRIDLHALRKSFGTMLAVAGVAPRVAMELMRHSDMKLTMGVYTDVAQLPLIESAPKLPSLELPSNGGKRTHRTRVVTPSVAQLHAQTGDIAGRDAKVPEFPGAKADSSKPLEPVALGHEKAPGVTTGRLLEMERAKRLELSTSTLARWCSTN